MSTRLDRTIAELEDMVTKLQSMPASIPENPEPSEFLNLLFLLPSNSSWIVGQPLIFDDVWIMVCGTGSERESLECAGFSVSPVVNFDETKGTESVTAEFQNAFLELMWGTTSEPSEQPLIERLPEARECRPSQWRPGSPTGSMVEIVPADSKAECRSMRVSFSAQAVAPIRNVGKFSEALSHPLGVRRVTAVRLVAPSADKVGPVDHLRMSGMLGLRTGMGWAVEITFDGGAQHKTKDLRPSLPAVLKY